MDRRTTDNIKFTDKIKSDLESTVDNSTRLILTIFPALSYDRHSIHFIKTNNPHLIIKTWDSKTDNEKFQLGVYNLDYLAINKRQVALTADQVIQLDNLIAADLKVDKLDGFILDGINYFLKITDDKNFEWQDKNQLNKNLADLFDKLCALANL